MHSVIWLFYCCIIVCYIIGGAILIIYGFPKVINADDVHTLLPAKEWTPDLYKKFKRNDLISRLGLSILLTGVFFQGVIFGVECLLKEV